MVKGIQGGGNHCRWGHASCREIGDLGEVRCEGVNGVVANRSDLAGQGLAPRLPGEEAG
jgi:hypothetical protein